MLRYHVRSRDLISLVTDLREGALILSPYFQRNLVWRDVHKRDFIETILLGLPFPQIFIAQGDIDVETLTSRSVVVDGQQRLNAIRQFVNDDLEANGKKFNDLDDSAKEEFLRYQVPVIDLDLKAGDPQIIDIFKRLNRTFYALSTIEKMSTEYATVDFMLLAKYACGFFGDSKPEDSDDATDFHPLMPEDFLPWAKSFGMHSFQTWLLKSDIFTEFEIARLVHLMFALNLMSTLTKGFFPRNDKTRELLDQADEKLPFRDEILAGLEKAASTILELDLKESSTWSSKSNAFTLFVVCFWHSDAMCRNGLTEVRERLLAFGENLPADYALAAREGVNNRRERILRYESLATLLELPLAERTLVQ